MDYLCEFTTAYDLALSPVDLETGFYQHLQHRSISHYWLTIIGPQRLMGKARTSVY